MYLEGNVMQQRIKQLKQLVVDSQYAVDEVSVAAAILARIATRGLVSETGFRNDPLGSQVASFRPSRQARSFRLCHSASQRDGLLLVSGRRR